jgi:hypothetical protein
MHKLARFPISRFHPSIKINNKILVGSAITEGGNIIISVNMVSVEAIMAMARNGSAVLRGVYF